ncbi:MAG: ABC transporter transmembrane domain-containing protein, partial [Pseudomonadota bacterium]
MIKLFSSLKEYFFKDRWYIAAGFFSLITVDIIQLIIPRFIKGAIDALTGSSAAHAPVLYYALRIAAAGFMIAIFRFFWRYCLMGTSRRIEKALRDRLFSHILTLPLKNLLITKTGDLMARLTNDLDAVRMCTGIGLVALVDTFFLGIASIVFMLCISPLLTMLSLTPLLFIIFITRSMSRLLHQRFSQVQASFSRITEKVRETISGITVIKAFAHEKNTAEAFNTLSADYIAKNLRLVRVWGVLFPLIVLFSNISIGMLIFFGGRMTISNSITAGDFVAFTSYIWILTWPMMALGWVVNLFQRGSASLIRLNEILSMEPEAAAAAGGMPRASCKGLIELRSLSFSYTHER